MSANSRCPTVPVSGSTAKAGEIPGGVLRPDARGRPLGRSLLRSQQRLPAAVPRQHGQPAGRGPGNIVRRHRLSFGSHQEIILKTGSVKVSGADLGKPVLLRPDEKLSLDTRTRQVTVRQVDARNYCSWFESRLIFDNTPLADIITNLERRYNVEIALSSHIRVDKRLSLVVYHEPLEDILDVMATLIPIRYRIDGNQVLITKK